MTLPATLRRLAAGWFARLAPGAPHQRERQPAAAPADTEALRRCIRQVTLEQLGIAHWSCHTLF